jgi:hypothetical protein
MKMKWVVIALVSETTSVLKLIDFLQLLGGLACVVIVLHESLMQVPLGLEFD